MVGGFLFFGIWKVAVFYNDRDILAFSAVLCIIWSHPFSTCAKFSEKLTFLTPQYPHGRVRIKGKKC